MFSSACLPARRSLSETSPSRPSRPCRRRRRTRRAPDAVGIALRLRPSRRLELSCFGRARRQHCGYGSGRHGFSLMPRACATRLRRRAGAARSAAACRSASSAARRRTRRRADTCRARSRLDVVLQRLGQRGIAGHAGAQHHVGLHDLAALRVGRADHAAFGDGRMGEQRRLHLGPGDVVAGRDDHVVGARLVPEVAVLIQDEAVAGQVPAVLDVVRLARVVEIAAADRPAQREPADRAGRHVAAVLVDDLAPRSPGCPAGGARRGSRPRARRCRCAAPRWRRCRR